MVSAETRAYNGGLGAEHPAGSRGRAPVQGQGVKPPEGESLFKTVSKFVLKFFINVVHDPAFGGLFPQLKPAGNFAYVYRPIVGTKHGIDNRESALTTTRGLLYRPDFVPQTA